MEGLSTQLTLGLVALAVFAAVVFVVYVLRGPRKPDPRQKANEQGVSAETARGARRAGDSGPHSEMEEGTANQELSPQREPHPGPSDSRSIDR